tara:strand:+ start:145 stop:258 length:114 start_codon:yes stop_codon:yes gene_type:complete
MNTDLQPDPESDAIIGAALRLESKRCVDTKPHLRQSA